MHLSSLDSFSTQTRVKPPLTIRHDVCCCFTTFRAGLTTLEWSDCGSSLLCQILDWLKQSYLIFTTLCVSNTLQKVHKTRTTCEAIVQLCTKQSVAIKALIPIILSRYFVACLKKIMPLVGQTPGPIECHKLCFIAYILYLLKYNVRLKSEHTYRHQLDAFPVEELQSHRDVLQLHLPECGALVVLAEHLLLAEHLQKRDQPEPIAQVRLQVR